MCMSTAISATDTVLERLSRRIVHRRVAMLIALVSYCFPGKANQAHALSTLAASKRPTCAIVGGGIAGLRCAQVLSEKYDVTVFDTGRLRSGGRCTSRLPGDLPADDQPQYPLLSKFVVDHAAQVLTVPPNEKISKSFANQVRKWQESGVLTEFQPGTLFQVETKKTADGTSSCTLNEFPGVTYYGSQGMGSIPAEMIREKAFKVIQDVWVSPSNGVKWRPKAGHWTVQAKGENLGNFEHLVIAHNGKCADRLMSKTPAKEVHELLRVNFASSVAKHGGKRMTLNSIYSLTFVLEKDSVLSQSLPPSFKGAFLQNENLRFLTCQTKKYESQDSADYEVWTLLSSALFAKKYKAPQEYLPGDVVHNVTNLLLRSLESSVTLPKESLQPVESRLQLWGAALPLNTWDNGNDFIYDDNFKVGVCGDWLCHSSIGGAWVSGERLGRHMLQANPQTVGMKGKFRRSEETHRGGIGSLSPRSAVAN